MVAGLVVLVVPRTALLITHTVLTAVVAAVAAVVTLAVAEVDVVVVAVVEETKHKNDGQKT